MKSEIEIFLGASRKTMTVTHEPGASQEQILALVTHRIKAKYQPYPTDWVTFGEIKAI